jgi:hypothetical protein
VVIISACYAGGFIEPLKNPQTIVIAAAAADRTSFGCGSDSDLTYFGAAFYRDALPNARTLRDAFEQAKSAIAQRERREHVDASRPQGYFGAEWKTNWSTLLKAWRTDTLPGWMSQASQHRSQWHSHPPAEQGSGPLVLLCHGFPESWYSWRHQLAALSRAGFHAVAPDMRGYGQSSRPERIDRYSMLHSGRRHGWRARRLGREAGSDCRSRLGAHRSHGMRRCCGRTGFGP